MKKLIRATPLILALFCFAMKLGASQTSTFSVGASVYVAVVAKSDCSYVTIWENANPSTTDFNVKAPSNTDTAVLRVSGSRHVFQGSYLAGTTVGWVETVSGTITMAQEETNSLTVSLSAIGGSVGPAGLSAGQAVVTNSSKQLVSEPPIYADQAAGATTGAKIIAALAAASPATTVDARGFLGLQSLGAATITIPSNVTLLLGCATFSGSANPMFSLPNSLGTLITQSCTTIKPTSTNTAILVNPAAYNSTAQIKILGRGTVDGNSTALRCVRIQDVGEVEIDLRIQGCLTAGVSLGSALLVSGTQDIKIRGDIQLNTGAGVLFEDINQHNNIEIDAKVVSNKAGGIIAPWLTRHLTILNESSSNGSFGTVNTNGTAVTWAAGDNFNASWPQGGNVHIKINGVLYAVASVTSTTALVLGSTAGVQNGVTYAFGPEISLQNSSASDLNVYTESSGSTNADYIAIQYDAITATKSTGAKVAGIFLNDGAQAGTAISFVGKNASIGSAEVLSSFFFNWTNGINLGSTAANVLIHPSTYTTVTNPLVAPAGSTYTKIDSGNLTTTSDNITNGGTVSLGGGGLATVPTQYAANGSQVLLWQNRYYSGSLKAVASGVYSGKFEYLNTTGVWTLGGTSTTQTAGAAIANDVSALTILPSGLTGISTASPFSVAGTPLPACASGTKGMRAFVSDATLATPGSAYVGSSTISIGVQCIFNSSGSVYTWIID